MTELSYDQLIAVVRAEGVDLREVNINSGGKNYNSHDMCRCHSGDVNQTYHVVGGSHVRGWAPDGDMTVHITAGDLGSRTELQYILDILLTNPNAPLAANFAVMPSGVAYILSAGRTNHDLNCSPAAKAAYDNSSWSLDGYQDLRGTGVDPKVFTYGIENVTSQPLDQNPKQYETSVRICAAITRAYGRNGRNVAGHGECASDRSYADPGINMGAFRRAVMARVSAGANYEEDDMYDSNAEQRLMDQLGYIERMIQTGERFDTDAAKAMAKQPYTFLAVMQNNIAAARGDVAALSGAVKALGDLLAKVTADDGVTPEVVDDIVTKAVQAASAQSVEDFKAALAASVKVEGELTVQPALHE